MKALRASSDGPVVWMNGDVVFEPAILKRLQTNIDAGQTAIAVNTAAVSDEEVKYTVDADGMVKELSKTVVGGLGESVGINVIQRCLVDSSRIMRHQLMQ
jgi:choline kinase